MTLRKLIGSAMAGILLAGLLSVIPVTPASALSPGVAFSADSRSTWQTNNTVWALDATRGVVVAGGTFTQILPPAGRSGAARDQAALAVFDAATGEPTTCQFTVRLGSGNASVRAVTVAPNGRDVYIGGAFTTVNGVSAQRIAKIDPVACTVDTRFRSPSPSALVWALDATDSMLYVGGQFTAMSGQARGRFAALDATTGALLPWAPEANAVGRAVQVSPDGGKVAIGGNFDSVGGLTDAYATAIVDAASGEPLKTWPKSFFVSGWNDNTSFTHTFESDAQTLYVGNEGTGGGVFDGRFAIDWTSYEQIWRDNCLGATQDLALHKGTLYAAHHAHDCASNGAFQDGLRTYFTAQSTADASFYGWFPQGNDGIFAGAERIGPRALAVATGRDGLDYLWAGGEFNMINRSTQAGLTRFGPQDTGAPPTPEPVAAVTADGRIEIRFRTVVDPDDSDLTYSIYRDNAAAPVWTGTAKSFWWVRPQVTFVDERATAGARHAYRVTASDGTNTSVSSAAITATSGATDVYGAAVASNDPAFFWRYEDAASRNWAQDSSGATTSGQNGRYQGRATSVAGTGLHGAGLSLGSTGTNDYVWSDQLQARPDVFTVETWFNTTTATGGKLVGFGNGRPRTDSGAYAPSGSYDNHVYMDDSGRLVFGVWNYGAQTITSPASYNDGAWHHVAASMGPGGMTLYVDGVAVGTNPTTHGESYMGVWRVGGDELAGWPGQPSSNFFTGAIDETAVYGRPLTAREIAGNYMASGRTLDVNSPPSDAYGAAVFAADPSMYWRLDETAGPIATDSSFNGAADGSIGGAAALVQRGAVPGSTALRTDGGDGSIVVSPERAPAAEYSLEAWFSTTSDRGGKLIGFENTPTGNSSSYDKHVYLDGAGRIRFGTYTDRSNIIESSGRYNDGAFHHVVATQGADGMHLYVDGALVGTNPTAGSETGRGYWRVGGGTLWGWPGDRSSDYLGATIDEVAVYDRVLSAPTVASHHSLGTGTADTEAPSAVGRLRAESDGTAVRLSWTAATDDVGVTSYLVHRGSDGNRGELVATVAGTEWTDTGATAGRHLYTVTAIDAAGNSGPATTVDAVVPDASAPTVPTALTATVVDRDVRLAWTASTDNVAVTAYDVYRLPSATSTTSPSTRIATVTSTAYTESAVVSGTHWYRVVATDEAGNASAPTDAVQVTVTDQSAEPVVVQVGPSRDTMVAQVAPNAVYGTSNQISARGDTPIDSYLGFDLPEAPAGTRLVKAELRLRTSNDATAGSEESLVVRTGTGVWDETTTTWRNRGVQFGPEVGRLASTPLRNTQYVVPVDATGLTAAGRDATLVLTATGADNSRFHSRESTLAAARPQLTLTYAVAPAPQPGDTQQPSTPGVTGSAAADGVRLTWSAAIDDVGVRTYEVHRGSTEAFAPSTSTRLGETTSLDYVDTDSASGTRHYAIVALDAAGNRSEAGRATVVVPQPIQPPQQPVETVIIVEAARDTMVAAINPAVVYGKTNQLSTRGTSAIESYLGFELPEAPAGSVLTGATLQLRTSNDATATSADATAVRLLDGEWSEDSTTWNSRPTGLGRELGRLPTVAALNSSYTVPLDVVALAGRTGQVSVALTSSGTDNARFWSRDQSNRSFAPQLRLVYTTSG